MVWIDYLPKKSLVVVVVSGGWQTKFSVSPGPSFWSLVHGPFGPDLVLNMDLDLDLSLTIGASHNTDFKQESSAYL